LSVRVTESRVGCLEGRCIAENKQVDDVCRRQRGLRTIGGSQPVHRTPNCQPYVVILSFGADGEVQARFGSVGINKVNSAGLDEVAVSAEDQIPTSKIHPSGSRRFGGCSANSQVCCPLQAEFTSRQIQLF